MQQLTPDDLKNFREYEQQRDQLHQQAAAARKRRTLSLGADMTLQFLNRDIVLFQMQEILRAERITDDSVIQQELDAYNTLLPEPNELSAAVFVEFDDKTDIQPLLNRFSGLTGDNPMWLEFETGQKLHGQSATDESSSRMLSPVFYLRFPFDSEHKNLLADPENPVRLAIHHREYHHTITVESELRQALVVELSGGL